MKTKLGLFAAHLAEAGWLVALVAVPLLFNPASERVFEEEKVLLLRALALIVAAATVVRLAEGGSGSDRATTRAFWRQTLATPVFGLALAYLLATAFGIAPGISFWGAHQRLQGMYTWLCYVTIFAAIVLLAGGRGSFRRAVDAVLLASFAAALYALVQASGSDPIPWTEAFQGRVYGTAGNPSFLAAFLIMAAPLALARLLGAFGRSRQASGNRAARVLGTGAIIVLLAVQALALFFSQSRAALLGLGTGLLLFSLLYAWMHGLYWMRRAVIIAALVASAFLAILNLRASPFTRLQDLPFVDRLARLTDTDKGSARVRLLIWEAADELLRADPGRTLVGYGPDTLLLAYQRFYPPDLAQIEDRGALPDRSHNETFDAIIGTGLLGCAAYLALFLCLFHHGLRGLGMIRTREQGRAFLLLTTSGGAIGGVAPLMLDGSLRFVGVGIPIGLVIGLLGFVGMSGRRRLAMEADPNEGGRLLLIGLLAAVAAHFVEISFGIAVVSTRLCFWTFAGLVVAIGRRDGILPEGAGRGASHPADSSPEPAAGAGMNSTWAILTAVALVVLTFGLQRSATAAGWALPVSVGMLVISWVWSAAFAANGPAGSRARPPFSTLVGFVAVSLGVWLAFAALLLDWLSRETLPAGAVAVGHVAGSGSGAQVTYTVSILYGVLLAAAMLAALLETRRARPHPDAFARQGLWSTVVAGAFVAAAGIGVVTTSLNISRADIFCRQGVDRERAGNLGGAIAAYGEALNLAPDSDAYASRLGVACGKQAASEEDPLRRRAYFARALAMLERARALNPKFFAHRHDLARLHRLWAGVLENGPEREGHFDRATEYYEEALRIMPHAAALLDELALMEIERGRNERALEFLGRAIELGRGHPTSYWIRAGVYLLQGSLEKSLADYDRALAARPSLLAAYSGKGRVLLMMNRLDEAIAVNQAALQVKPDDLITHRNLAVLYHAKGDLNRAVAEARVALRVAPPSDRKALEGFVSQIRAERQAASD